MKCARLAIATTAHAQVILVRSRIEQALAELGVADGLCHLWCPHTTAGITVNEGADPDVPADFLAGFDRLVPWGGDYRHGEGNAAAHIKAMMVGASVTVPVAGGRLALGTWQDVYFCEFDGPRRRTLEVRALAG
jgi:secondary thiamine-phosphate synthase enzyme